MGYEYRAQREEKVSMGIIKQLGREDIERERPWKCSNLSRRNWSVEQRNEIGKRGRTKGGGRVAKSASVA